MTARDALPVVDDLAPPSNDVAVLLALPPPTPAAERRALAESLRRVALLGDLGALGGDGEP